MRQVLGTITHCDNPINLPEVRTIPNQILGHKVPNPLITHIHEKNHSGSWVGVVEDGGYTFTMIQKGGIYQDNLM